MDPTRFDRFAKVLARGSSRRTILRGLAAATGGLVAAAGAGRADAIAACCTGKGGTAGGGKATGGSASACCAPPYQCYSSDGRGISCPVAGGGTRYSAEGGRAGCCLPSDTVCQSRITTRPPCPGGCTCV